jgi:hypothetical protein
LRKKLIIPAIFLFVFSAACSQQQPAFSVATDLEFQHSFKKEQRYSAVGQTVNFHFSFTPQEGAYIGFSYYSFGKFTNHVTATAKASTTTPQQINYTNYATMRYKHISIGWKHYFKGSFDTEEGWSLYGFAGFGLMLGVIENVHSIAIDTFVYKVPVISGRDNFKRLTLDLGLGYEIPLGGDVYFYAEGRAWVPTTDYPSPLLFVNKNAPFMAAIDIGVRILF